MLGLLERDGDTIYDSAVTITPDGTITNNRKSHLYPPEVAVFGSGAALTTVTHAGPPWWPH